MERYPKFLLEDEARWILSPAYDLTCSNLLGGEHVTMVNGNGTNPRVSDALEVAKRIGISRTAAKRIATQIKEITGEMLGEYL